MGDRGRVLLIAVVLASAWGTAPAHAQTTRPNVVVIQTDDQSMDTMRAMVKTQRLIGDSGVTFADYHASFALCCPSRATLLTGQYAHNTGVRGNVPPEGSVTTFDDSRSLPLWLQRAGYATAHVGKYLNLYNNGVPPGWNEWFTGVDPTTYRYFGYTMNDNGVPVRYGDADTDYTTDVYTARALEFIRREAGRPFFLALDYVAPHTEVALVPRLIPGGPPRPAPRDAGKMKDVRLPRDPSFDEEDVSDKPAHLQRLGRLSPEQIDEATRWYRARLESLIAVDDGVERVIQALEQAGVLDNTYVFYVSDNGWLSGQHRYHEGKLRIYEPATRIPLLVRGPGVSRGAVTRAATMNVDLAPTIADLTGARPDLEVDGVSLAPVLREPRTRWARYLLHEYVRPSNLAAPIEGEGGNPDPSYTGVRSSDGYVYVEHQTGERELYDLARDPHQLANRADDRDLEGVQSRLAARLAHLRTCRGEGCRFVGAPLPPAQIEAVRRTRAGYSLRLRCLLPVTCRTTISIRSTGRRPRTLAQRPVRIAARAARRFRLPARTRPRAVRVIVDAGADGRVQRTVRAAG